MLLISNTQQDVFFKETKKWNKLFTLLSNSQNCEHLKNFKNVDCVLANHNKVQDMQANLKTTK